MSNRTKPDWSVLMAEVTTQYPKTLAHLATSEIEEISDQNDPYANEGERDKKGRGRKRFSVGVVSKKPKWKSQLSVIKSGRTRRSRKSK